MAMATSGDFKKLSDEEYNNLSSEERDVYDKQMKEREEAEQAKLPYQWRQTLQDVDVTVQLPKGTRGRDLAVTMQKRRLKAGLKGQEPIMEGELCADIRLDDSTWTVESGELLIHLEKVNQMEWWKHVLTHHPAIDTTKIQPENSKLSDLDGETRAMVEKMMFDQQQKAMGKPSSEEMNKMEMLKKFQQQHPDMDFSNAKFM
ncbi:HSP20-like chaperone [Gaertneriomyces semiglobifer]|nr:HSP20-like chaperone [Gaertneriomyces semiglobifer]